MKLLHLADLHLGSEMRARLTADKARTRREEICSSFLRAVDYAKAEGIQAVLLCGDVFDTRLPLRRDKQLFYDVVRSSPEITFFYLKGNHDGAEKTEELPNLKTFGEEGWTTYSLGEGVTVSGIELTVENSLSYYDSLHLEDGKKNIVMLHGQIAESVGTEKIRLRSLAGKNIDYLALGHLHSYSSGKIDARGSYVYSGCLEARGFDECGDKGFVVVDTQQSLSHQFVPHAVRTVREVTVDVGGTAGIAEALQKMEAALSVEASDMPRVYLVGEVAFDTEGLEGLAHARLKDRYFAASVKDQTKKALDLSKYEGQVSIEAEFIRVIMEDSKLTERQKRQALDLGLKALSGGKL